MRCEYGVGWDKTLGQLTCGHEGDDVLLYTQHGITAPICAEHAVFLKMPAEWATDPEVTLTVFDQTHARHPKNRWQTACGLDIEEHDYLKVHQLLDRVDCDTCLTNTRKEPS